MSSGISVVVPAFNRAPLIAQTLKSIFGQTLPADEIIVVDDGSTDSTIEAAEAEFSVLRSQSSAKGKLPDFKVIRQENAGPGAARNRGFAESSGRFIHFFDSDDIAAPNKHEVQVGALQTTGADIAYGPWVKGYIREHRARSVEQGERRYSFEPHGHVLQHRGLPQGDLAALLLARWSIVPQAGMFRRSIVESSGGFAEDVYVGEDQIMFLRCLLRGAKVVHTPETIVFYRLGDEGKLTESPLGAPRRITGWAEFLIRGGEILRESNPAALNAWLFRKRCWGAMRECASMRPPATEQVGRLQALAKTSSRSLIFHVCGTLSRWRGGIRQRLTGDRQDKTFRTGPLTGQQQSLFPAH